MQKLKTIHIDDDSEILEETEKTLKMFSELTYIGGFTNIHEAFNVIETVQPDLIILDMELNSSISFKEIDFSKVKAQIVVLSGHAEYALNAFQFDAIYYILKPARITDFQIAINKAKENIKQLNQQSEIEVESTQKIISPKRILIGTAGKMYIEQFQNIMYIKADGSISLIYLSDERIITSGKIIKHYKSQFMEFSEFMEISRSAIINLGHVKVIIRDKNKMSVKMTNGEILSVSVQCKDDLISRLSEHKQ